MRFSVTRRQHDGGVVTLAPAGEVDLGTAGALRAAIQDTLHTPHPVDVVVDLGRVTFLDCAGIGALVAGRNTAIGRGRGYMVVNPPRPRAQCPGDHRRPCRPHRAFGSGTADRSAGPISQIEAPPTRPAGSGWTACAFASRVNTSW